METKTDKLLNNINGFPLDCAQRKVVTSNKKHLLVSAGAGSGKTLTIIGKIRYLIEIKNLKEDEIVCISFTNEATNNLKNKLKENYNYNIPCYTFHKLGLEILKTEKYQISKSDTLSYIINEYFISLINQTPENKKRTLSFLNIKYNKYNFQKKYQNIPKKDLENLKNLIEKFINLFKANDYPSTEFINFLKNEKNKKYQSFIILTYYIFSTYQKELESKKELDFSDMISLATKHVERYGFKNKIKYIIIDEFQDTSKVRFNLIKAILKKTNASLLVVGDDFQSIYRFTGCDLSLFLEFKTLFKDSEILKIENTYRNSQELINIAGNFIMKNKNQLKKDLKSTKHKNYPLKIVYYKNFIKTFIGLIEHIHKNTNKPILILGRNNFDVNKLTNTNLFTLNKEKLIYNKNKDIKMTYLTVHRSKGLEEENVIIINLTNNKLGFPNKITDHQVLKHVSQKEDNYPHAEERRLFYVAITRTKNTSYLLTPLKNESIFITELIKDYKNKIKVIKNNKF